MRPVLKRKRRKKQAGARQRPRLQIDHLEDRLLMAGNTIDAISSPQLPLPPANNSIPAAAGIYLSGDKLTIQGGSHHDTATVSLQGGSLQDPSPGFLKVELLEKMPSAGGDILIGSHNELIAVNTVSEIVFYGYDGADSFTNYTSVASTAWGHGGWDVLVGGSGVDALHGGAGCDTLEGRGGDDYLAGGLHDDTYRFAGLHLGSDTLHETSSGGNDTLDFSKMPSYEAFGEVHGIEIDLSEYHLTLNPSGYQTVSDGFGMYMPTPSSFERVIGSAYNDGIFSNEDVPNTIQAGMGEDFILTDWDDTLNSGDDPGDQFAYRAKSLPFLPDTTDRQQDHGNRIYFKNGKSQTMILGSNLGEVTVAAGTWEKSEIITVVNALEVLVALTNNDTLINTESSGGIHLEFINRGNVTDSNGKPLDVLGANNPGSGEISLFDLSFNHQNYPARGVVYHEMAHNWDEFLQEVDNGFGGTKQIGENPWIDDFRAVGGWKMFNGPIPAGYEPAKDGLWSKDGWGFLDKDDKLDRFAKEYGKQNPLEDFATAFNAYVNYSQGEGYGKDPPHVVATRLKDRFAVIDQWIASITTPAYQVHTEVITSIDGLRDFAAGSDYQRGSEQRDTHDPAQGAPVMAWQGNERVPPAATDRNTESTPRTAARLSDREAMAADADALFTEEAMLADLLADLLLSEIFRPVDSARSIQVLRHSH